MPTKTRSRHGCALRQLANANDIVATLPLEGRFTSVNQIVGRILGYTSQEMIGAPLRRFVPTEFHPTHAEPVFGPS